MENKLKMDVQKQRTPNFSVDEKLKLVSIIERYASVIESKVTKTPSSERAKDKAWQEVLNQHNQCYPFRTIKTLMTCWTNLKKLARQYLAQEKLEQIRTGGGVNEFKKNALLEEVLKIIGRHVEPIPNLESPKISLSPKDQNDLIAYLISTGQILDWSKFDTALLKKPVSSPLHLQRVTIDEPQETQPSSAGKTKKRVSPSLTNQLRKINDTDSQEDHNEDASVIRDKSNPMKIPIIDPNKNQVEVEDIPDDESSSLSFQKLDSVDSVDFEAAQALIFKDNYGDAQMIENLHSQPPIAINKLETNENVPPQNYKENLKYKKKKLEVDILEADLQKKKLKIQILSAKLQKERRFLEESSDNTRF